MRALCVSIHDVAPRTSDACRTIAAAIARIEPHVPLTLLVVPLYHGDTGLPRDYLQWIDARIAQGDELALHGYTHLDDAPRATTWIARAQRQVYTAGEGEFAALTREEARERIAQGREWFRARGWPVQGFVAPAWLVSEGTWEALRESDLVYTTTLARFHVLQRQQSLRAPSVVYSTRSTWRRVASRAWNAALVNATRSMPLVRVGLHPADAAHPDLITHALDLVKDLARERTPITKSAFARAVS